MNAQALCEAITHSRDAPAFVLAGEMLRVCRRHAEALAALRDRHLSMLSRLGALVAIEIGNASSEVISEAVTTRLCELVMEQAAEEALVPLAARAIAEGLEEALGERLAKGFDERVDYWPGPDDPVPIADHPVKEIFGSNLNTDPRKMGLQTDSLRFLRLVPRDVGHYRVRYSWLPNGVLAGLRHGAGVSAGLPNTGLGELDFQRAEDPEPAFHDVKPRDVRVQEERLLSLLERANEARDVVVVLPELCLDERLLERVRDWWRQPGRRIGLLVAGSAHVQVAEGRVNETRVLMPGDQELAHRKFGRFSFPDSQGGKKIDRVEAIERFPAIVTVCMAGRWSFCALICKDLLDPTVVHMLVELRVRLVLVPSLSAKTDAYEAFAHTLAAANQAVTVVANTPNAFSSPRGQIPGAIFGQPIANRRLVTEVPDIGEIPALCRLELGSGRG